MSKMMDVPSDEYGLEHAVCVPVSRYEELLESEKTLRSLDTFFSPLNTYEPAS